MLMNKSKVQMGKVGAKETMPPKCSFRRMPLQQRVSKACTAALSAISASQICSLKPSVQSRNPAAQRGLSPRNLGTHRVTSSVSRGAVAAAAKEDVLFRSLSEMGEVAVYVVDGTNLVTEAATRHSTAPTATAALGRALLGTLLMAAFKKEGDATQVSFQGDGPLGNILVVADHKAMVKGKVGNPQADPPLAPNGKLAVGAAVGRGVLTVVRSHPLEPRPFTGIVPIISGEVAEDLANYLVDSEQTNTALGLGVSLNRDCSVRSAGGFMIQVLPFCSEETLEILERNLSGLGSVTNMMNEGMTVMDIRDRILADLGAAPDTTSLTPTFGPCEESSLQQRMVRALAMLGEAEVKDIMAQEGKLEVTCDFCNQQYQFPEEVVLKKIEEMRGGPEETVTTINSDAAQ